jgi:hypothetical protein
MVGNNAWNAYTKEHLEQQFPNLAGEGYLITSPDTIDYNCVAWAADSEEEWWWPDSMAQEYWPADVPREETLPAFTAARQLPNGEWTSKIGQYEDIQHKTLDALTGEPPAYGTVLQVMKKAINPIA